MTYQPDINKLDNQAVDGLLGVSNSLAYKVHEIERHLHSGSSWFELAGTPSGETHVAVRIGDSDGAGAFVLDAGDSSATPTWGSWVQILGSSDTPARTAMAYFDPHQIAISAAERTGIYYLQFGRGDSGAAALAAGTYTEIVIDTTNRAGGEVVEVQTGRAPAGSKLWARCLFPGQDTATISLFIGIHEYEG